MSEDHQDRISHNLITTEKVTWIQSKKSKLLIPQHENQKRKRFKVSFDWLNLIGVLLIPFVVTVIGLYATQQIIQQQILSSESQHQTDIQIAQNQQDETVLTTYINNIQDLLLNHNLLKSKQSDNIAILARARTLSALSALNHGQDGDDYNRILLQFLYQTTLISRNNVVISLQDGNLSFANLVNLNLKNIDLSGTYMYFSALSGTNLEGANLNNAVMHGAYLTESADGILPSANLRKASLEHVNLFDADLYGVNLSGADLHGAVLSATDLRSASFIGADLSNAYLIGAKVTNEQLSQAKSLQGATMPDGSVHP
jgi:uncharacterized protein YjbI with pentapeptide repeats